MSYFDVLNRFRVKISQSPKSITLTSVHRFKKCPKNRIKATLRKDGKISVTTDHEHYKKVKEKFGDLLTGAKYESENTGKIGKSDTGRDKKSGTGSGNDGTKKKGPIAAIASVLDRTGGDQPTKGDR